MPRGDKTKYTDKQERKAEHIADSYEARGVPEKEAESRAWATVNKDDGGGKQSGSGRGGGHGSSGGAPRRRARRQGLGLALGRRSFGVGEEGGCDAEAQCGGGSTMMPARSMSLVRELKCAMVGMRGLRVRVCGKGYLQGNSVAAR